MVYGRFRSSKHFQKRNRSVIDGTTETAHTHEPLSPEDKENQP